MVRGKKKCPLARSHFPMPGREDERSDRGEWGGWERGRGGSERGGRWWGRSDEAIRGLIERRGEGWRGEGGGW